MDPWIPYKHVFPTSSLLLVTLAGLYNAFAEELGRHTELNVRMPGDLCTKGNEASTQISLKTKYVLKHKTTSRSS